MMRPSWEQYFKDIARLVSCPTCLRRQVGAALVKDNILLLPDIRAASGLAQ